MSELSHAERKQRPVLTGLLDYFPDACMEVARCSFVATEQHHPGSKMHWDRNKSIGEGDEIVRHLMDRKKHPRDTDGVRTLAKAAWRALELLQREIEAEKALEHLGIRPAPIPAAAKTEIGKLMSSGRQAPPWVPEDLF